MDLSQKKLNITLKLIENKYKDTKNFRKAIKQNENMAKSEMPKTKKKLIKKKTKVALIKRREKNQDKVTSVAMVQNAST